MSGQQLQALQGQKPGKKRLTWVFWVVLAIVILITIGLVVLIAWLFATQDFTKASTVVGLIASFVAIVSGPLILMFTIRSGFGTSSSASSTTSQSPPPVPLVASSTSPTIPTAPTTTPEERTPIWNIPYPRNQFFTGREDVLKRLHDTLIAGKAAALAQPQAISGLGGIGKTQTAVEYAYRYQNEYQVVLWAKAETRETLVSDFVNLAGLLQLPEQHAQDQSIAVAAVKRWLQDSTGWLLILDNADDLGMANDFLPVGGKGHILLTTRAQAMGGVARKVEIEEMKSKEGALFLLRRAGIIAQDAPLESAKAAERAEEISQVMDGLPLALDQAGAYIEETVCGLAGYLDLYRTRRTELFKQRGGIAAPHPEPVATTWSLSFQKVEQANPAAAELLRLCAFLQPDAIPEEIITEGASELGAVLQPVATDSSSLNAAIRELLKYSLLRRDPDARTLTVHRLVQEVLLDGMDEQTQREWAERTVRAVNRAFPDPREFTLWGLCQRCLPHAQACAALIEQWGMTFTEAARLLNQTGYYLDDRAQYVEAEPLYRRAIAIWEKILGPEHPYVATSLNNLAALYDDQGKYAEAEPLYRRALAVREKALGSEHPDVAHSLNNLALLYAEQGKYGQAEPLYQRVLAIWEKTLGPEHPDLATSLNNLALLYKTQGKYAQAEPLYRRALTIDEQALGPEHPNVAIRLNNLANLYSAQGKYAQAEPLYQRALKIDEQALGPEHPDVAIDLNNLAKLYADQGKYGEAEPLYRRALAIWEKTLGEHPNMASGLENYAGLLRKTNREAEAAQIEERAREIRDKHARENPT